MKIILPPPVENLVRFDSLSNGNAFFTSDGSLAFRALAYGGANAMVCLNNGGAVLCEFDPGDMVEPCEATITAIRPHLTAPEDEGLTTAERDLVDLDRKILAIKSYRERHACSLKKAKEVVDAYVDLRNGARKPLPTEW